MRPEFKFHKLSDEGQRLAVEIAERFTLLTDYLEEVSISGPELTIAKRKLEEACFYAKKAMAQRHCEV